MSPLPGAWQVTLCDPIWHASSRSGESANCYTSLLYFTLLKSSPYSHPNETCAQLCASPSLFSERELEFMFAICHRPSVRLSVVCLSVTFVRPTQAIKIFGNIFTPFCRLVIYELSVKILRRSSQGNPSIWG